MRLIGYLRRSRPSPAMIVALIALTVALSGVAVGATRLGPSASSDEIRGCVDKSGVLRIPKRNKDCPKGQTEISWNQKGPKGSKGSTGAKGATGAQGVPGTPGGPGQPGTPGTNGTNGTDGTRGPTGDRGPTGLRGPTGDRGPTGP